MELFEVKGYEATSMEDIAKAVGVTAGALYGHFQGKADILDAVVLDSLNTMNAALSDLASMVGSPRDMVARLIRAYLDVMAKDWKPLLKERKPQLSEDVRCRIEAYDKQQTQVWADVMAKARPDLTRSEAGLLIRGALAMIYVLPAAESKIRQPAKMQFVESLVLDFLLTARRSS